MVGGCFPLENMFFFIVYLLYGVWHCLYQSLSPRSGGFSTRLHSFLPVQLTVINAGVFAGLDDQCALSTGGMAFHVIALCLPSGLGRYDPRPSTFPMRVPIDELCTRNDSTVCFQHDNETTPSTETTNRI